MLLMKTITALIIVWCMGSTPVFAQIQEPGTPRVDKQFSAAKEKRIKALENMVLQDAFGELALPEFIDEDEYLNKGIYRSFNRRTEKAVDFAMRFVWSTQSTASDEGMRNLYLAKRTFEIFPNESLDRLLDVYSSAGPKIRANVIYVVGQMTGGRAPLALLTEALHDTSICQELSAEALGEPLRICDMAYNQLVIRYPIKNVMRTIGTGHRIEVRDYHIGVLSGKLR